MSDKSTLRRDMLARRAALDPETVRAASAAVTARLLALPVFAEAVSVLAYLPVKNEVDPKALIEALWARKAQALLPRCLEDRPGELDLAGVSCLEETRPGRFGIAEPLPHLCRSPDLFSPDLILVPGVAFDRCGRRLGFGGGYYDRLLARPAMRGVAAIGLAYDFQILEELPADPWDVALSGICSEKELLWTKR